VQKWAGFSHGTGLLTGPVQPEGRFLYRRPPRARAVQKRGSILYGKWLFAEPNGLESGFGTGKAGFAVQISPRTTGLAIPEEIGIFVAEFNF